MGKKIASCAPVLSDMVTVEYEEREEKPKKMYTPAQMYREIVVPSGITVRIWNLSTIRDCYPMGAMLCDKRTLFGNRFGRGRDAFNLYTNWIHRQPKLMQHIRITLGGKTDLVCGDRCKYRCHVETVAKIANPFIPPKVETNE